MYFWLVAVPPLHEAPTPRQVPRPNALDQGAMPRHELVGEGLQEGKDLGAILRNSACLAGWKPKGT